MEGRVWRQEISFRRSAESIRKRKDLHICRSVVSIDYLMKMVEFLCEIGGQQESQEFKMTKLLAHRRAEQEKVLDLGLQTLG